MALIFKRKRDSKRKVFVGLLICYLSYELIADVVKERSDGKGESSVEEQSLADTGSHIRESS